MSKADREHMARVAALGCIVCRTRGMGETPAEVHHIRDGYGSGQRAPHTETLPLCAVHHRLGDGTAAYKGQYGYHWSPALFEGTYGAERELLEKVREMLNGND